MSIIYDALQKTQQNRKAEHDQIDKPSNTKKIDYKNFDWFNMILLVAIAILLVATIVMYALNYSHKTIKVTKQPLTAPIMKPLPKLVLNGVFVSDQDKVAMVNNQSFHLGELVEGMKIIAIDTNSIKLQDASRVVVLQVVGS